MLFITVWLIVRTVQLNISSWEAKGLTSGHFKMQLDPFASLLTRFCYDRYENIAIWRLLCHTLWYTQSCSFTRIKSVQFKTLLFSHRCITCWLWVFASGLQGSHGSRNDFSTERLLSNNHFNNEKCNKYILLDQFRSRTILRESGLIGGGYTTMVHHRINKCFLWDFMTNSVVICDYYIKWSFIFTMTGISKYL